MSARTLDTNRWRLTGFGGSMASRELIETWERMIGTAVLSRNGSFLMLWITIPGDDKVTRFGLLTRDLDSILSQDHGAELHVSIETDVESQLARRLHLKERT